MVIKSHSFVNSLIWFNAVVYDDKIYLKVTVHNIVSWELEGYKV